MYFQQHPSCPIEYLPAPFYEAVNHVCRRIEAPPEVVVADAFAVTSTLTQRRYKVKGFNDSVMPTTLDTLSLAPPVTGKGESYKMFFQSPEAFESGEFNQTASDVSIDDLLLQDVSETALMAQLAGYGKSVSIQLEDGYSFLAGPLMKPAVISKLPQAWSGPQSIKFGRYNGNKNAIEPCLAIGLRIQPELFYAFLKRDKNFSRNLGLWPRFMVFCYDPGRFPATSWNATASMTSHLPLMERLATLLPVADAMQESDQPPRKVLVMDTHANAHLREIAYWIKGQLNGEFHDIQDAAGRAAEITLRLASNFHVVCQGEGPISRDMIERAWAFTYWSLGQFRNVFVHAPQPPPKPVKLKPMKPLKLPQHQERLNADMQFMLNCIGARSFQSPKGKVPLAEVAVLTGFSEARFLRALGWLVASNLVEMAGDGEKATVRPMPSQLIAMPNGYSPFALSNTHL